MKSSSFISILLAITVASSNFAFAQGRGNQREGNDRDEARGQRGPDHRGMRQPDRRNAWGHGNLERDERWSQRGAGPNHEFRRGDRLPMEYRHKHFVVNDWRGHNLSAPPRGYYWVQSGADYILVAVATGLILQILFNH